MNSAKMKVVLFWGGKIQINDHWNGLQNPLWIKK